MNQWTDESLNTISMLILLGRIQMNAELIKIETLFSELRNE